MDTSGTCPVCGQAVAGDGEEGFCVGCLLGLGLGLGAGDGEAPRRVKPSYSERRFEEGDTFAGYEIEEEIARGAMGLVLRARHVALGRVVALKVMLGGCLSSVEARQRFRLEAEAVARLDHPNIVPIFEVGEFGGQPFFCMKLVEGPNLVQALASRPIPAPRAAAWVMKVARAVHHAHQRGILHRDVKPSNILIDAWGEPQLIDFGLARIAEDGRHLTRSRTVLGTPAYMAPEMALGDRGGVTVAADIFGLGAVLYELLSGAPPFAGSTPMETLRKVCHEDPPALRFANSRRVGGIGNRDAADLETICRQCLEKSPRRRYASAAELADDLQRWLEGEPVRARPPSLARHVASFCRRRPTLASMVLVVPLLTFVAMAGILMQWLRAERHADAEARLRRQAEAAVVRLEIGKADRSWSDDNAAGALRQLSEVLNRDPGSAPVSALLVSMLGHRPAPVPIARLLDGPAPVHGIRMSPDGRFLLVASGDRGAKVLDARTGRPAIPALRHENPVSFADFSADGLRMVVVEQEGAAWIRTGESWGHLLGPLVHGGVVSMAAFSPDGSWLVTTSEDGTARLWSADTGAPKGEVMRHGGPVLAAAFSPDGSVVYTGSFDHTVRAWTVPEGRPSGEPLGQEGPVRSLALSPDGTRLLVGGIRGTAVLWSVPEGRRLGRALSPGDSVDGVRFSPDGLRVATASGLVARVWDANSGLPITHPMLHEDPVTAVEFAADGEHLITCAGGAVWAWRWAGPLGRGWSGEHVSTVRQIEFRPDGRFFLAAPDDLSVLLYEVSGPRPVRRHLLLHESGVRAGHFSPDGSRVVTVTRAETVPLWDVATGNRLREFRGHSEPVRDARFDSGGSRLVTASDDGTARVWNVETGEPTEAPLPHPRRVDAARFSPDGRFVVTACADGNVRVWEPSAKAPATIVATHGGEVRCVEVGPDGRSVLSGGGDGSVHLRRMVRGEGLEWSFRHDARVNHVAWSPDGERVITASNDRTARIREVRTGRSGAAALGHGGPVVSARFASDGRSVVTASWDGTARVWDTETCLPLGVPLQHAGGVFDACFGPTGGGVWTAGADRCVRLWDVWLPEERLPWLVEVAAVLGGRSEREGGGSWGTTRLLELALEAPWRGGSAAALAWGDRLFGIGTGVRSSAPVSLPGLESLSRRVDSDEIGRIAMAEFGEEGRAAVMARLGRVLAPAGRRDAPARFRQAEWLVARALRHAPGISDPWLARADLLEREDRHEEAVFALEQAVRIGPDSVEFGIRQARSSEHLGRIEDAFGHLCRVLALPMDSARAEASSRGWALQTRARLLERMGNPFAAARDRAAAREILRVPERPATLADRYLDLTPYFTQGLDSDVGRGTPFYGSFARLPRGLRKLGGVDFDVRGLVVLAGDRSVRLGQPAPRAVGGIPVRQSCRRIRFLHATSGSAAEGSMVARYVMHLRGGSRHEMIVRYRQDLMEYWRSSVAPETPLLGRLAWSGSSPAGSRIALYEGTWENPRPDLEVESLDLVSAVGASSPIIFAVTLE